jgi:hypothetical protein
MAKLTYIQRTIVDQPDFVNPTQDININIELGGGETLSFTAEKEFFTPRRIATNTSESLGIENTVQYTANNIAIIKQPNSQIGLATPQYYANSIVKDIYRNLTVDTFFTELDNDLAVPEYTGNQQDQRAAALKALLNLNDAAAAAAASDPLSYGEAQVAVDESFAQLAGLQNAAAQSDPSAIITPDEQDQLSALDFVGLGGGTSDIAADQINPLPEINDSDLIKLGNSVRPISGKTAGIDTINKAIEMLNFGVQETQKVNYGKTTDPTGKYDAYGKCKVIEVAKGKKGVFGIGKTNAVVAKRVDIEDRLAKVNADIEAQQNSDVTILKNTSGVPTTVKIQKGGLFGKLLNAIGNAGVLGAIAGCVAGPLVGVAVATLVPKGNRPMNKNEALQVLEETKKQLEALLAKDC